ALIFGTLLSSQGTDASFVLTSAHRLRLSSGLLFFILAVLRFRLYQTLSRPIPGRSGFRFPGSRFRVSLSGDCDSISDFHSP
ncbi:hypothetical protein, partial [Streptomyces sp. NPDC002990]